MLSSHKRIHRWIRGLVRPADQVPASVRYLRRRSLCDVSNRAHSSNLLIQICGFQPSAFQLVGRMKVSIFAPSFCVLLPFALALPTAHVPEVPAYASSRSSDDTRLFSPLSPSACHHAVSKVSKTTLHRVLLYTSRMIGAKGTKWTSETLHLSVATFKGTAQR